MASPKTIIMTGYTLLPTNAADPRFPSFLQGFNRRWYAAGCEAVYICYDAAGTVRALSDALNRYGSAVKIKSGGHCYEDFVFNEGTRAIIDVTGMQGYGYDPDRGYYLESGGTNWTAFQNLFRDYGKVLPAGSCYSVGLGGHICGGGYGLLSRLNGLTVDWLTGIEVVVKDNAGTPAYPLYVSANSARPEERDLFWAHCGGGGGNFGIITRYYFKDLPDAPVQAFITAISLLWSNITESMLANILDLFSAFSADPDNWRQFGLCHLFHEGHGEIVITIQTAVLDGEDPEAIKCSFIDPLLETIRKQAGEYSLPSRSSIAALGGFLQYNAATKLYTFYEAVQTVNGSGANQRGKYKSAYMRKSFTPLMVSALYQHLKIVPPGLTAADMAQSLVQVDSYGGRINTIARDATAIPQRSSIMKLQYQTYWSNAENDAQYLAWIRNLYKAVYAATGGIPNPTPDPTHNVDGCYFNYPDVDLNDYGGKVGALQLYFGENLPRLIATKSRWDPNNYFNNLQSIPVK